MRDLFLTPFYEADDWVALDLVTQPPLGARAPGEKADLGVAADGNALRQALVLRLLTPQGALATLGHAAYGSRLHELIGRESTAEARRLARSFVLQAIAQERRVARVLELTVQAPEPSAPDRLRIFVRVEPASGLDPVALGIEVAI